MPSWRGSCECYALPPVAGAGRWLLLLLSPLLSGAVGKPVPTPPRRAPCSPGCGPGPALSPIGLTAADPFAGGRCQGLIRVYVNQALSPVLVAPRSDRPLTPYRRRITILGQSGGAFAPSTVSRSLVLLYRPLLPLGVPGPSRRPPTGRALAASPQDRSRNCRSRCC